MRGLSGFKRVSGGYQACIRRVYYAGVPCGCTWWVCCTGTMGMLHGYHGGYTSLYTMVGIYQPIHHGGYTHPPGYTMYSRRHHGVIHARTVVSGARRGGPGLRKVNN